MAGFSGTYAGNWLEPTAASQSWWNPNIISPYLFNAHPHNLHMNNLPPIGTPWTAGTEVKNEQNGDTMFNPTKSSNGHPEFCAICGRRYLQQDDDRGDDVSAKNEECDYCDPSEHMKKGLSCSSIPERSLNNFLPFPDLLQQKNDKDHKPLSGRNKDANEDKLCVSLCKYISDNVIGKDTIMHTPFGYFKVIYLDYTASGRSVKFIEAYIRQHVLPIYANTHSETSCCAEQTDKYREDARNIIRKCVNATDKDVVLFVGSGTTGAVHKLIETLNLKSSYTSKVTVVISALEHHSNILPWKESGVEVIRIPLNKEGTICIPTLTKTLKKLSTENRIILCSFTAASNVTGIILDVENISALVHSYGGYVFWDYAAAAPYIKINMNSSESSYKDAIFISGHKFVGGPGSPGILIAKYYLFKNPVPTHPGGGTVVMVTKSTHIYMGDIEKREEGGTPDIIGSIRIGLAFQLKQAVTDGYIEMRDQILCEKFFSRLGNNKRIIILGNRKPKRLPIFSFLIVHQATGLLLHHNFIGRLLNDLFGIQCRTGCVCAGPYTQDLLDIDEELALKLVALQAANACKESCRIRYGGNAKSESDMSMGIMKVGFTRISLPFFYSDCMINEIIDMIQFIADHGWYFLPQYTYGLEEGIWSHRTFDKKYNTLEKITYENGRMYFEALVNNGNPVTSLIPHALAKLREAKELAAKIDYSIDPKLELHGDEDKMRWFLLPGEAAKMIVKGKFERRGLPFVPLDGKDKVRASAGAMKLTEEKDKIYISKKKKDRKLSPEKKPKI